MTNDDNASIKPITTSRGPFMDAHDLGPSSIADARAIDPIEHELARPEHQSRTSDATRNPHHVSFLTRNREFEPPSGDNRDNPESILHRPDLAPGANPRDYEAPPTRPARVLAVGPLGQLVEVRIHVGGKLKPGWRLANDDEHAKHAEQLEREGRKPLVRGRS